MNSPQNLASRWWHRRKRVRRLSHRRIANARYEALESRCVLAAVLELQAQLGELSQENGLSVLSVDPGAAVPFHVIAADLVQSVQGYQLNLRGSDTDLQDGLRDWQIDANVWHFSVDDDITDGLVAASVFRDNALPVDGELELGRFSLDAPTRPGDYRLSLASEAEPNLTTALVNSSGTGIEIEDHGDVIIRVQADEPSSLQLIPSVESTIAPDGSLRIVVQGGRSVSFQVNANNVFDSIAGYQLNFAASDVALLNAMSDWQANSSPWSIDLDGDIADGFVAANAETGQSASSDQLELGTFSLLTPNAAGEYRLTLAPQASDAVFSTQLTGVAFDSLPIREFIDVIVNVETPEPTTRLALVPDAGDVTQADGITYVSVAPGALVPVSAVAYDSPQAVAGFQLNLTESSSELTAGALRSWDVNPQLWQVELDSDIGDQFVAAAADLVGLGHAGEELELGVFDVRAPLDPGEYRLTLSDSTSDSIFGSKLVDSASNVIQVAQFEDLVIQVGFGPVDVLVNAGLDDPSDVRDEQQPTSWQSQRSDIQRLDIEFNNELGEISPEDVRLINLGVSDAGTSAEIDLDQVSWEVQGSRVRLEFTPFQLPDGVYSVEVTHAVDVNGIEMENEFVRPGSRANGLYKLMGDANGDAGVSVMDFAAFAYWFAEDLPPSYIDLNQDGRVSIFDVPLFRENFGVSVTFADDRPTQAVARALPAATESHDGALALTEVSSDPVVVVDWTGTILRRIANATEPDRQSTRQQALPFPEELLESLIRAES